MTRRLLGAAAGLSLVVAFGVGCSSSGESTSSGSATTTAGGGGGDGCAEVTDGAIKIITEKFDFQPDCITMTGDRLKVTYDNQEDGVKHNINFKGAKASTGKPATELKAGPDVQTVTLVDLKPGSYEYICDIHANMKGELTVK